MTRDKLYTIFLIACFLGYGWLFFSYYHHQQTARSFGVCLVKETTGVPCPSCGTTRAVKEIFSGDWLAAWHLNPIGFVITIIMTVVPLWVLSDLFLKKDSFFRFYKEAEKMLKKRWAAIPLIFLIVVNWIWNIIKGV